MPQALSAIQGLRPVQVPDPTRRFRMLAEARQGMQQEAIGAQTQQMNALKIKDAETEQAQLAAVQQALIETGGDVEAALPKIIQAAPTLAPTYQKYVEDQKTSRINRDLQRRNAASENVEMTEGTPGQQVGQLGMQTPTIPSEWPVPTMAAPIATGFEQPHPEETIPGSPDLGIPSKTVRPLTFGQLNIRRQQQEREKLQNEITLRREQQKAEAEFAPKPKPVPGRDIPLPADVAAQRTAIANASRAPQASEPLEAVLVNGKPVLVPRSQAAGMTPAPSSQSKPPTEGERTAMRFYERMKGATEDLSRVEESIANKGLGGQAVLKFAPNVLQPEENQLYQQAQRAFTEARLRKDSGAAIPEYEFENDRRMYFAQPGDTKAVIEQKRKSRETAMSALRRSAARAYEETYGESPNNVTSPSGSLESLSTEELLRRLITP